MFEYYFEGIVKPVLEENVEPEESISLTPPEKYDEDDLDGVTRLLSQGGDLFIYSEDEEYILQINTSDNLKAQVHKKKD